MGFFGVDDGSAFLTCFHEYILMQQYFIQVVGVFCFADQNRLTTQQNSELHSVGEKTVQWGEMKKSSIRLPVTACACEHCVVDVLDIFHVEHVISYNSLFWFL